MKKQDFNFIEQKNKEPEITNIAELMIYSESVKGALGLKDEFFLCGSKGIKCQIEKLKQGKFKDYKEILLFYIKPTVDELNEPLLKVEKMWFNRETNEKIDEPQWFKDFKASQPEKKSEWFENLENEEKQ